MDVNKDTVVDFNEWVRVLGTYCMFTFEDLQQFVFASFDSDGDGFLGNQDMKNMIRLVDAEHKGKRLYFTPLIHRNQHITYFLYTDPNA